MSRYDGVGGFEYWNIESWRRFISKNVVPFDEAASRLLEVRKYIMNAVGEQGGIILSEMEKSNKDLLPLLLGVIDEKGDYKQNSLAKLQRMMFGFYINPGEWVTLEKESGIRASDYVTVGVEPSKFLEFLNRIHELCRSLIDVAGIEVKQVKKEAIKDIADFNSTLIEPIARARNSSSKTNHSISIFIP